MIRHGKHQKSTSTLTQVKMPDSDLELFVTDRGWQRFGRNIFVDLHDPSIEFLELYAVTVAVVTWIYRFRNRRIVLFCDNQAAVAMINSDDYIL